MYINWTHPLSLKSDPQSRVRLHRFDVATYGMRSALLDLLSIMVSHRNTQKHRRDVEAASFHWILVSKRCAAFPHLRFRILLHRVPSQKHSSRNKTLSTRVLRASELSRSVAKFGQVGLAGQDGPVSRAPMRFCWLQVYPFASTGRNVSTKNHTSTTASTGSDAPKQLLPRDKIRFVLGGSFFL